MTTTAYHRLVTAVETTTGATPQRNGPGVKVQCPVHDDNNPSLSIRPTEGSVLLHCFAGCSTEDVLSAVGLELADLYDNRRGANYSYTDRHGKPTRTVRRTPTKKFSQIGAKGCPELYRLPAVITAVADGRTVYLVEGEKDVHALETLGAVATTAPMGATNFRRVDVAPLQGARIVAVPDQDDAGEKWLHQVATALDGVVDSLSVARAKTGKDAADHVAAGYGLDQFVPGALPDPATVRAESTDPAILLPAIREGIKLRARIKRIVKTMSTPAHFRMETDAGTVILGTAKQWATRPADFSAAFLDIMEMPELPTNRKDRNELCTMIARAAELENIGDEATDTGWTRARLRAYLAQRPATDTVEEAAASEYPFNGPDGRICMFGPAFRRWLFLTYQERQLSDVDFGRRLRAVGCLPDKINVDEGGKRTSRGIWRLPADWQTQADDEAKMIDEAAEKTKSVAK